MRRAGPRQPDQPFLICSVIGSDSGHFYKCGPSKACASKVDNPALELCPRLAVAGSGDGFLFYILDGDKMQHFFAFGTFDVRLYNSNR
jgi:hypothetical protein